MQRKKQNGEKALRLLSPILREWRKVMADYLSADEPDLPFWHGERPQVGFLAAAAARQPRAITLEEWRTKRRTKTKKPNHKTHDGRNDLWLRFKGQQWFFEAKYIHIHLNGATKISESVKSAFKDAAEQAAMVDTEIENESARVDVHRVAVVFAALSSNASHSFTEAKKRWKKIFLTKDYELVKLHFGEPGRIDSVYRNSKLRDAKMLIGMAILMKLVQI